MEVLGFSLLALVTLLAAVMVVAARKVVHSVFWLLLMFFSTACIFLLINAEFLAVVQILVNAGAVVISFLFVIILTNLREESRRERYHKQGKFVSLVVILLFLFLGLFLIPRGKYLQQAGDALSRQLAQWGGNSQLIAKVIFSDYVLPFEIVAIVLLVAIIGVIVLGKREAGPPPQEVE